MKEEVRFIVNANCKPKTSENLSFMRLYNSEVASFNIVYVMYTVSLSSSGFLFLLPLFLFVFFMRRFLYLLFRLWEALGFLDSSGPCPAMPFKVYPNPRISHSCFLTYILFRGCTLHQYPNLGVQDTHPHQASSSCSCSSSTCSSCAESSFSSSSGSGIPSFFRSSLSFCSFCCFSQVSQL